MRFVHDARTPRVVFGAGAGRRQLRAELERLGCSRALLITTPGRAAMAREVTAAAGPLLAAEFAGAVPQTPVAVTASAMAALERARADGLVALGGGSSIGLAKALALRSGLPQLVLPTTYAGSEMTPILGETADGEKRTSSDPAVLPRIVIYDPELLAGLPPAIAGPSAMNAMAHAVEALYAEGNEPLPAAVGAAAIRRLGQGIGQFGTGAAGIGAVEDLLCGAWMAGLCLGSVGMALHHKLCHVLGGSFGLPHADTHCLLLPYTAAYNRAAAPAAMATAAAALAAADAPEALYRLARQAGRHHSLAALGLARADLEAAATQAVERPYFNPRPVTREGVLALLEAAWAGHAVDAKTRF